MFEGLADILSGGVIGSALGGLFRLIPEGIKYFDRKNERAHELKMFTAQVDLEKTRGQIKLDEIDAQREKGVDEGVLTAFNAAINQQTEMTKAAGGFAASLAALVRPLITYWVWALYSVAFLTLLWTQWEINKNPAELATIILTPDFMTLLAGITNFWFLDRMLAKRGL